jgi:hypothetical protein
MGKDDPFGAAGESSAGPRPKQDMELEDADPERAAAVSALADELVRLGAALALILDHMARAARGAPPDAESIDLVLLRLLCEVLAPALDGDEPAAIRAATALLARASETIGQELFLVELPPDPGPSRRLRPPRGRRPR